MHDPKKEQAAPNAFFRGLEEVRGSDEAQMWREDEFPHRKSIPDLDRRDVLKLMGGTMALAGLAGSGCRSLIMPQEKLVSFVQAPEDRVSGVSKHFATVTADGGDVMGILVRQYEGRPVKIEGNPRHPASLGACDARTLATIYDLYDPDRVNRVTYSGSADSWSGFLKSARQTLNKGGVAILTGHITSPSLAAAIQNFVRATNGRWFQWEPINNDNEREGQNLAFNSSVSPVYDFTQADVIVSLDCDVFDELPGSTRYMGDIMGRRNPEAGSMSRLYAFESSPTTFGALSDHRVPVRASQMVALVKSLAGKLGIAGAPTSANAGANEALLNALVAELRAAAGRAVLVAGRHLPAAVHAAVIAINESLRAPVRYESTATPWSQHKGNDIKALAEEIKANRVKSLLILGGNPAYDAPADLDLKALIGQVPWSAHLSLHDNETGYVAKWQLPLSHYLESWGDQVAFDGTVSVQQPLVQPLFDSRSALQLVDALAGTPTENEVDLVRVNYPALATEDAWNAALANGVVQAEAQSRGGATFAGSGLQVPAPRRPVQPNLMAALPDSPAISGLEVRFAHDAGVYDGRFTNNPWLMEMPRPLTNLTWDNAIEVGFKTAQDLGLPDGYVDKQKLFGLIPFHGDAPLMKLTVGGQSLVMPVYVNLGVAEGTLVVRLGYGRERGGQIGTKGDEKRQGGGFNTYALRATNGLWSAAAQMEKAAGDYPLANTQFHNTLDVEVVDRNRDVIRHATFADYKADPAIFAGMGMPHHGSEHGDDHEGDHAGDGHGGETKAEAPGLAPNPLNLYPGDDFQEIYDQNPQWAMTVDLSLCTGCNACVIACQSENNIPTVGKYQVMRGREMHWIRIDRYYKGTGETLDYDNPPIYFQPLACVQCEQAPCEPVCPVAATTHSGEGINQMVYNRCVGTRYCSNNCPYKVRRFNFLHYTGKVHDTPVLRLLQNPDVTVRTRGVMEKCTYCVQRISAARIQAKLEDRNIEDGEVVTACQQACPAKAIVFGNKSQANSKVAESRRNMRNYVLLESTNTRPRTTYLGRVENPNPEVNA